MEGTRHGAGRHVARAHVAVLAAALLVAAGIAVIAIAVGSLGSAAEGTQRTSDLLERVIAVESSVVDAETGVRGFVITDAPVFLQPLHRAQATLGGEERALIRSAVADHELVARCRALVGAANAYVRQYVPQVLAMMRADAPSARAFGVTLTGKTLVDLVRRRATLLDRTLDRQQTKRQNAANATAGRAAVESWIVLGMLVLLTGGVGLVLARLLLARERALEESRRTAGVLQTSLLPIAMPSIPGCDIAARFVPAGAGQLVGGDFYDVFQIPVSGRWALVVGDVVGKGTEAAATTAMVRWTLRSLCAVEPDPTLVLGELNAAMLRRGFSFLFATVALILVDIDGRSAQVTVACAGHPQPVVIKRDGHVAAVPAHGTLVGAYPDVRFETATVSLEPGDQIVAFTDGVTDVDPMPADPPERILARLRPQDPESTAAMLERRALDGRIRRRDDVAIIALRFCGENEFGAEA